MIENKGPIFIGGLDRCGKTLLRALLVSHPRIAIPEIGSNYWTFFYKKYGDISLEENFESCLSDMARYTHVTLLNPDFNRIRREFFKSERTYEHLFGLLNQQYAEKQNKPRWGDQTGLIERFADQVLSAYPGAKMIHLIRDPRDRYEASKSKHPNGKGKIGAATARWKLTTQLARRNLITHPDHYMIIQYETLVTHPEQILKEVCNFLEENFSPEMLEMSGAPDFREKILRGAYGNSGSSLISTEFIGRYKKSLTIEEIKFMQQIVGKTMNNYGYQMEKVKMSSREKLAYYTNAFPDNWMRFISWLIIEKAQRLLPERFGKTPPKDKIKLVHV